MRVPEEPRRGLPAQTPGAAAPLDGTETAAENVLRRLRRHARLIAVCALVVPAAALALSLASTKEYTASAALLFETSNVDSRVFGTPPTDTSRDPERVATTNLKLVSLDVVAARTAQALRGTGLTTDDIAGSVAISPQGTSNIASIDATNTDPRLAAQIANQYGLSYIRVRQQDQRNTIQQAQAVLERRLSALSPADRAGPEGRRLRGRASDLELLSSLQTGDANLVQPATVPESASSPKTARNVALGIILGLALGVGLALLRSQFDRRLQHPADVRDIFDLPVLADVPLLPRAGLAGDDPGRAPADALSMLRANLKYFNVDRPITSILVTSPGQGDGSTTVAWGLACAEARTGTKVLCIEADMRAPRLGLDAPTERPRRSLKGAPRQPEDAPGLSLVLRGSLEPAAVVRHVDGVDLITAGPLPPNPAALLESQRMADLLSWAHERYERVIVDTPPLPVAPDAIPLIGQVDGVVVVVRLGHTRRDAARRLAEQLSRVHAAVLGVVVNGSGEAVTYRRREHQPVASVTPPARPVVATGRGNGAAARGADRRDREDL